METLGQERVPGKELKVGGISQRPNIHVDRPSNNLASHCHPRALYLHSSSVTAIF